MCSPVPFVSPPQSFPALTVMTTLTSPLGLASQRSDRIPCRWHPPAEGPKRVKIILSWVLANEKRHYVCNVFFQWLIPCIKLKTDKMDPRSEINHVNGLVQDCGNSTVNKLKLRQSCAKWSMSKRRIMRWCMKFNSSPPGHHGRHFADNIFRCISVNEKFCILIQISLEFVPKGPIDNNAALVQVMAWCWIGDKLLPEPMLTQFTDTYMLPALGGVELNEEPSSRGTNLPTTHKSTLPRW